MITRVLYTLDLSRPIKEERAVLVLTDTMATCGFNYATGDSTIRPLQKAVFHRISVDPTTGTVLANIEFGIRKITALEADECRTSKAQHPASPPRLAPPMRLYPIRFDLDGQGLKASPESADAMRTVQDQRAARYPAMEPVPAPSATQKHDHK